MAETKIPCIFSVVPTKERTKQLNQYADDFHNGKENLYSLFFEGYYKYLRELEANVMSASESEKDEKVQLMKKAQDDGFSGYVRKEREYLTNTLKSENKGRREKAYEGFIDDIRGRLNTTDINEERSDAMADAQKDMGVAEKAYRDKVSELASQLEAGTLTEDDYNTQKEAAKAELDAEITRLDPIVEDGITARQKILENNPHDILEDMKKLVDMPKTTQDSLNKYREDCIAAGEEEKFNEVVRSFMDSEYQPSYEMETVGKDKDKKTVRKKKKDANGMECDVIRNEYKFERRKDKDGKAHDIVNIHNLEGTDLNISWIDGKLGFMGQPDDIKEEQAKALAKYCYDTGMDFDNYNALMDLKIVDKDGNPLKDEDGNEKSASKYIEEEMKRLNGFEQEQEYSSKCSTNEIDTSTSEAGWNLPYPKPHPNRSAMERAAINRLGLMGYHSSDQYRCTHIGNRTIISVYSGWEDKQKDGEFNQKSRKYEHTKHFAIVLDAGEPPSGSIYVPAGKEMKADHARTLLDTFKAQGYKYVSIPEATDASKVGRGAFLQACVKTGMIPVCKPNPGGTLLAAPDLETLFKAIEEEPMSVDEKTEFQMRVYQQLEKAPNFKKGDIYPRAMKLKYGANFNQFTNSHVTSLSEFIQDGVSGKYGEKWDQIDRAAAVSALAKIVKEIEKGTLNGKPYNPLAPSDQNLEALQKAMVFYMGEEKQNIVKAVNKALNEEKKEIAQDSKINSAIRTVCGKRDEDLKEACASLEAYGVKFTIPVPKAEERGYNGSDYVAKTPSLPNEGLRQAYTQGRRSSPTPTNQKEGGR